MTPSFGKNLNTTLSRKRKRIDTDDVSPSTKIRAEEYVSNSTSSCDRQGRFSMRKRSRSPPNPTSSQGPAEDIRVRASKRKASDEGDAPEKKRCSCSETSGYYSGYYSSYYSTLQSSSAGIKKNVKEEKGRIWPWRDLGTVSAEEEEICRRSSSGNKSRTEFQNTYTELEPLGSGGFGTVFRGRRRSDSLPICNDKVFDIILEVAFMLKTTGLTGVIGQSSSISLLDWYTLDDELILVMERPVPCVDLKKYVRDCGGLDEQEAKMIFKQMVDAAIDTHAKGVFHRDIKLENVLVQFKAGELRVRLIDFGCGSFSDEKSYNSFRGTVIYSPPECFDCGMYKAHPTTVWQLGALLFSLIRGHKRFNTLSYLINDIQINSDLSKDVKTLLYMCLRRDPLKRATLEELKQHPALKQALNQPI
ncbi:serine/threonine-protein kinase pim-2-like [Xyrichtys novacula]|uniref:non-specific serine/threonine protein kinase n=1 Tax=Xyrichtys novacula TaxID=13765 RepID=A0AAV1GFD1_XYRNO|nr:serine/threonine-protein kinase pim-2-like [Xyrichtys novacula]